MPLIGNIKTRGELQNDIFCLQEERDFFQSKFLEQVSEIKAVKDELAKSKKEIRRLRVFLMDQENQNTDNILQMPHQIQTPKNSNRQAFVADGPNRDEDAEDSHIAEKDDASSLTQDEMEDLDKQDERLEKELGGVATPPNGTHNSKPEKEEEDVRKSAEKLLAWASYRSNMSSRTSLSASASQRSQGGDLDHSSIMSPSVLTSGSARQSLLGKMIETIEDEDDDDENSLLNRTGNLHVEEKKEEEPSLGKAALSLDTSDEQ